MNNLKAKKIYLIASISLILGVAFDYLFYGRLIGISFLAYVCLLLGVLFGFLLFFRISYTKTVAWFLPAILFFALLVGVRENEFLVFWNILLTLGLLLLMAQRLIGRSVRSFLVFDYVKTAVLLPLNMLAKSFTALGVMISVGKGLKGEKTAQIAKGILITLPIVLLFFFLFSSADLVFNKLVTDTFRFNFTINPDLAAQIWLAIVFTVLWLGAYIHILENTRRDENVAVTPIVRRYKFGNIEAGILFTTLSLLFLTFVTIQIRYLFAGHEAITRFGYTYAEYVHKGFGELIVVALSTFALIFLAERYIERRENKTSLFFKALTGLLIVLVLVIMASAFTRLGVYEQAYGFTLLRILVQAFIIWLAAIFLWLGYKIMRAVEDRPFIFGIFLSALAFFAFFNLFNPDAFVTRKNIDQFANSEALDTKYLTSLSADAVPALIPLLDMTGLKDKEGNPVSAAVAGRLKRYYESVAGRSWQSYNLSRNRALSLINSKWDVISTLAGQK